VRVAYLVLAHHRPRQLRRLVERLRGSQARFYIHVDRRAPAAVSGAVQDLAGVQLVESLASRWGDFSLVSAILRCLYAALDDETVRCDVAVLLSGQDYPIKPVARIEAVLAARAGRSTLHSWKLPSERWANERGGADRYEYWNLRFGRRFLPIFGQCALGNPLVDRVWNGLARRVPLTRRFPAGLLPYGGSGWWAMDRADAEEVRRFIAQNPAVIRFFRGVKIPDEMLLQTILMNSPGAERVVNEPLHFQKWPPLGAFSPSVLTVRELDALAAAPELFARKFDEAVDAEVLDAVDERLL
jgi:Core-2/I-Branching enzyme